MNVTEKMSDITDWLNWQHARLSDGLRTVADAERLYDYWRARPDELPDFADTGTDGRGVELAPHRIAALGYDPLAPA